MSGILGTPSKMRGRLGTTNPEEMDTPLRKRLADLEKRRQSLIDAMSKYQDAKRSALFQYLNENQLEDEPPSLSRNMGNEFTSMYRDAVIAESKEDRDCSPLESIRDSGMSDRDTSAPIIEKRYETSQAWQPNLGRDSARIESRRDVGSRTLPLSSTQQNARSLVFSRMPMDESVQNIVSPNTLRRETRSMVLAEKRKSYRKRQFDDDPTQSVETLPPRTNSEDSANNDNFLAEKDASSDDFLGDSDSPSDEIEKQGMKGKSNTTSQLLNETKNATHETLKESKVERALSLPMKKEENKNSFTEWKKRSIASRKSKKESVKHPIIARLRELRENNSITISNVEENEKQSKLFNRLDEIIEDVDARQATNEKREKQDRTKRDKGGKHQIEERFLKLFVDEEDGPENHNNTETNFEKTRRTSKTSEILTNCTKSDAQVDSRPQKSKDIVTPAKNDNDGDHMALLEAKLNMMISRKPLWQKALQDLYDEPIDRKISASTSSSSRTTKPPSEAETICSSNPTKSSDSSVSTTMNSERSLVKNITSNLDSSIEKDATESHGIENAKKYLDNLPECLSGLYENSSAGEKSRDETEMDEDKAERDQIGDEYVSDNNIVRQGEGEIHSAYDLQKKLSNIPTESNESSETEEDDPRQWEVEDIIVEYVQDYNDVAYQTTNSSCSSSIRPLDDDEERSNHDDARQYELMALSTYTEDQPVEYVSSESTEESAGVRVDSQSITVIDDCSTPTNEDQLTQEYTESYDEEYDEIDVHHQPYDQVDDNESYDQIDVDGPYDQIDVDQPYDQIESESNPLRMNKIDHANESMHQLQNSPYSEHQDLEKTHLHSNRSKLETTSTTAVFKTSPMANVEQQFFQNKNRLSKDSIFSDIVSELSEEDATLSLQVSSSNSMDEVDVRSGDLEPQLSSPKPSIPNEVTMQTDFTVQSITYEPNTSYVESLGEESVVRQARKNRNLPKRNMFSGNSESTVIAEKRKRGRKETALQVDKANGSCTKNLLSAICQCTGPVVLTDVDMCDPKRESSKQFTC